MRHEKKDSILKIIFNRIMFIIFYIIIIGGVGIGGYFIYLSFYDFYFENEEVDIEVGEKATAGLITKRDFQIEEGDYIYTIGDDNIAVVDENGYIIGVSEGETTLEVKYKHSLMSKIIKVVITPDDGNDANNVVTRKFE